MIISRPSVVSYIFGVFEVRQCQGRDSKLMFGGHLQRHSGLACAADSTIIPHRSAL